MLLRTSIAYYCCTFQTVLRGLRVSATQRWGEWGKELFICFCGVAYEPMVIVFIGRHSHRQSSVRKDGSTNLQKQINFKRKVMSLELMNTWKVAKCSYRREHICQTSGLFFALVASKAKCLWLFSGNISTWLEKVFSLFKYWKSQKRKTHAYFNDNNQKPWLFPPKYLVPTSLMHFTPSIHTRQLPTTNMWYKNLAITTVD